MGETEDSVTAGRLEEFKNLTGFVPAWVYFSNNWYDKIRFPKEEAEIISSFGSVPFIRMMPRSEFIENAPDPVYSMQSIISEKFDSELRQWAIDAKQFAKPLLVEFGTEVNGNWFSWNGKYNGGKTKDKYGDKNYPDGPERFIDAYRHIIDLFRKENVNNITWFYHIDAESSPEEEWNSKKSYYPGDEYIDWIGVSIYGGQEPGDEWESFTEILDRNYIELLSISNTKPIALLEFGTIEDPAMGNKAKWIEDALVSIKSGRYPEIKAVCYWHSIWRNEDGSISNMRLDSSPEVLNKFKQVISDTYFAKTLKFR